MATLKVNNETIVVDSANLPSANPNAKGAVIQGDSVPLVVASYDNENKKTLNGVIKSLRQSGAISNTKFRLLYDINVPDNASEYSNPIMDNEIYENGEDAEVKFRDGDDSIPSWQGHNFLGWATDPTAQSPTYSYADFLNGDTFEVEFTTNDITLYAIWEVATVQVIYNIGEYGTGSLPSTQTVNWGSTVTILFSPAPSELDETGRVFVGWATSDGQREAEYTASNPTVTLYSDIYLYPVFAYTVTYLLGSYATGSVPNMQYAQHGDDIDIDFSPAPSPISGNRVFCGWALSDGMTDYRQAVCAIDGQTTLEVTANVILYPVFAQVYTLYYNFGSDGTGYKPNNSQGFYGQSVSVSFYPAPTCLSDPSRSFIGWATSDLQISAAYTQGGLNRVTMVNDETLYPVFEEAEESETSEIYFDFSGLGQNSSIVITGYDIDAEDWITIDTITTSTTKRFDSQQIVKIKMDISGINGNVSAVYYNGTYLGDGYTNEEIYDPFDAPYLGIPGAEGETEWSIYAGDSGTISFVVNNE